MEPQTDVIVAIEKHRERFFFQVVQEPRQMGLGHLKPLGGAGQVHLFRNQEHTAHLMHVHTALIPFLV